ncbi:hypothetical protein [Xanthobacter sediminis]
MAGLIAGLVVVSPFGTAPAQAQAPIKPPNCKGNDPKCYKEVRVVNNTNKTLYIVIQGSIQKNPALGKCPQGDVWLQRALNDTKNCYIVNSDYYAYINPKSGVKPGQTISVSVPWYSTPARDKKDPQIDPYIDWWRGGRIYMFDDNAALNESYSINAGRQSNNIDFPTGPTVKCNASPASSKVKVTNVCVNSELVVYRAKPDLAGSQIQDHTPYQLNEWTFADVTAIENGGNLITLNLNYNVSNVDQVYLPVALQAITPGFTIGYLGTATSATDFQSAMTKFIGPVTDPKTKKKIYTWPIYNNPVTNGKKKYPLAGVRLPSTLQAYNFFMNPSYIDGKDGSKGAKGVYWPTLVSSPAPAPADPRPTYIQNITDNWNTCTSGKATAKNCPKAALYAPIKLAFDYSYQQYLKNCWKGAGNSPAFMAPADPKNPNSPPKNEDMYLRFVHGWVPIRLGNIKGPKIDCTPSDVPELPLVSDPPRSVSSPPNTWGNAIVNYMNIQYDWQTWNIKKPYQFNPYTQFIHDTRAQGGLEAASYAFSIDDHASFRGDPGTGLIFAVGGVTGLPNPKPAPPPLPQKYDWYTASLNLGAPYQGASRADSWTQYAICDGQLKPFPNPTAGTIIGLDPTTITAPCTIVLQASSQDLKTKKTTAKTLKITLKQMNGSGDPPYAIWNTKTTNTGFDSKVLSCSGDTAFCKQINEMGIPYSKSKPQQPPNYAIFTPPPFPLPPPSTARR